MDVRFACPSCQRPARLELPPSGAWRCPSCSHAVTPGGETDALRRCAVCGNPELYRKKDFPHWLGLLVLGGACLLFLVGNAVYHQWWAWLILVGSAVFDGVLYLVVGDVVVCYRCAAEHRGVPADPARGPFELGIAERYRQERHRREQLQAEQHARASDRGRQ